MKNKFEGMKKQAIVNAAVIGGTIAGALSGQTANAQEKASSPVAKPEIEVSKDGLYVDNIRKNKEKELIRLEKLAIENKKEIDRTVNEIIRRTNYSSYSNDEKLRNELIFKFPSKNNDTEVAYSILKNIINELNKNNQYLTFFEGGNSLLGALGSKLREYKKISDAKTKIQKEIDELNQEIIHLADCNTLGAPEGTNETHSKVHYVDQTPNYKISTPQKKETFIHKVGEKAGDVLKAIGEGIVEAVDNKDNCNCGPEIFKR